MKRLAVFFVGMFALISCNNPQAQTQAPEFTYKTYSNADFEFEFEYPSEMSIEADNRDGIHLEYPEKNVLLAAYHTYIINEDLEWVNLKEAYDKDLKSENVKHFTTEFHDDDYYFRKGIIDGQTLFMSYTIDSERGFYIIEIQYFDKENEALCEAIINHAKKTFSRT